MITIYLSTEAYLKMKYYTDLVEGEVSGLGRSEIISPTEIMITDIFLLKQEVTSTNTEIDKDDLSKFLLEQNKSDQDVKTINVWWHSHDTMEAFFSTTDDDTASGFVTDGFIISIVTNKAGKFLGRIDFYKPLKSIIDENEINVLPYIEDPKLKLVLEKEIDDKVTEKNFNQYWKKGKRYDKERLDHEKYFKEDEEDEDDEDIDVDVPVNKKKNKRIHEVGENDDEYCGIN